jgi:predicted flap endonuclease-1-like 5' DNA nuclease
LTALEELGSELGRAPTKAEVDEHGTYDSEWYEDYFDSWEEAISAAGLESPSRHDLLDELERLQDKLGFVPARHHVEEHGKYPPRFYRRRFDSVKQATTAAGMDYRDDVIEAIQSLAVELGRKPRASDFDEHAPYSNSYVYDLFDSWAEACVTAGVNSDEAVQELTEERQTSETGDDETPPNDGTGSGDTAGTETDSDLPTSPLAEYYEVFGNLLTVQQALLGEDLTEHLGESEPMSRWHTMVRNRWAGESTEQFDQSYGAQQNERTEFSIQDYRDAYGNGEHVTEFQAIETAPLPEPIVELVSYLSSMERSEAAAIRIPKAPDSGEPLPVLVESTAAYDRARSLLETFPDRPATTNSTGSDTTDGEKEDDDESRTGDDEPSKGEEVEEDDTDDELTDIGGVTPTVARALRDAGYHSISDLKAADKDELAAIEEIDPHVASRIKMIIGS